MPGGTLVASADDGISIYGTSTMNASSLTPSMTSGALFKTALLVGAGAGAAFWAAGGSYGGAAVFTALGAGLAVGAVGIALYGFYVIGSGWGWGWF